MNRENAMQPQFPSEKAMGDFYLGIAIVGVDALIAMGVVIAFVML
jgi:hypothetical protein